MTLRTGKSGQYRYYTCSTKARQGETGCKGRTVPMEKLDTLVADHLDQRLLQPKRLERILSTVLHRREERAERRAAHIAQLRKRATETEAKLSGDDVAWKISITSPMPLTLAFTGKVSDNSIKGEMGIGWMGSFPFKGTKA